MNLSINNYTKNFVFNDLRKTNQAFNLTYKGDRDDRQPVNTVYGRANLFKYDSAKSLPKIALQSLTTYAPDFITFAKAFEWEGHNSLPSDKEERQEFIRSLDHLSDKQLKSHHAGFSYRIYKKIITKLKTEGVKDFRIDFEDGFGNRSDEEEDETAINVAKEVAKGMKMKTLPIFIGTRIKPFTEELKARGLRILDLYLATLLMDANGKLPGNFVVMLPKVTIPEQITALVSFLEIIEKNLGLSSNSLKMEMMVQTTQAIMDRYGSNAPMRFIDTSQGRCIAIHFGTYDYTASNDITAKYQEISHAIWDFAHYTTKIALAHTGIWLSDGATNTMPIGPYRGALSEAQKEENAKVVHAAWRKGYGHIRHSLYKGPYQGWDLNPSQLTVLYAAVYAFFLESYDDALVRLRTFIEKAARAALIGHTFDDATTGQGLLNYFLKGINSGAISTEEVFATGLTLEELRTRSFVIILKTIQVKTL